jgi:hypothetical protein
MLFGSGAAEMKSVLDGKWCLGPRAWVDEDVVAATTWPASMPSMLRLREILVADRVELVGVESTSDYWRARSALCFGSWSDLRQMRAKE